MPTSEPVACLRYFFVLPEPVGFPDRTSFTEAVGVRADVPGVVGSGADVSVTYHQVTAPAGLTISRLQALNAACQRYDHLASGEAENGLTAIESEYTVVEAFISVPPNEASPNNHAPFRTCLRLVEDHVRAFRLAANDRVALPAWERLPGWVLLFVCDGVREIDSRGLRVRMAGDWKASLIMLDNQNLTDAPLRPTAEDFDRSFAYWMRELRVGNPLIPWRERFAAASRARDYDGDHATAVLHAATAVEVFLDGLLLMLCWEEGMATTETAAIFEEGKLLARIQSQIAPRLPGRWSTSQPGAVRDWYEQVARLRNRVIHAGHNPSPFDSEQALKAATQLQVFAFDRLAQQRNEYKRVTLLTLADTGLQRRGMWNGAIRRFAEGPAVTEPNWQTQFRKWRDEVLANL